MICLGSLYNTAKKKMQLFVSWSVAVSFGPAHNQVHVHSRFQGMRCSGKLLVMGELGNIPLEDAHPHVGLGKTQLRETQVRFGVREGICCRERKGQEGLKKNPFPSLGSLIPHCADAQESPMWHGRCCGLPVMRGRLRCRQVTQHVSV